MKAFPHVYEVKASGTGNGSVAVSAAGLAGLDTAAPAEFGGPGDLWSPETLLVAAVANCFILTFRAVARASQLPWQALECRTEGVLDKVSGVTQFSHFATHATLTVLAGTDAAKATLLLEKAEKNCLIANSLRGERSLEVRLVEGPPPPSES